MTRRRVDTTGGGTCGAWGLLASKAVLLGLLVAGAGTGALGQDVDVPDVVDERFELSQVYSTLHIHGSPTQTLFSSCSDHVLLIGKGGIVGLYPAADNQYTFAAQPDEDRESYEILVDLRDETNMWGDHGLLSAQLHPDFPTEPYLFLFYSVAPEGWSGECTEIINGLPFCEQNAVLERLTIDVTVDTDGTCSDWSFQDSSTNRVRLMEEWCASAGAHHNAAMEFYSDGSLLVANGDSSQASFDPGYVDEDKCYKSEVPLPQGNFKPQNENFLQGHLIRIHADALLFGTSKLPLTDANYDIWGKGLRNPFRLDTDKTTGDIYIGDVGDITIEEINILRNPLEASEGALPANFGWPCVEGDGIPRPTYSWVTQTCDSATQDCDICDALFACTDEAGGQGDAVCDPAYVSPSFQYTHGELLTEYQNQEGLCTYIGNSISAIAFFEGRLFAADYSKKCLWFFEAGEDGRPDLDKPIIIAQDNGAEIVDLVDGGDGYLYATNFALSKLLRIDPGDNLTPIGAINDDEDSGDTSSSSPVENASKSPASTPSPAVEVETPAPTEAELKPPNARVRASLGGTSCKTPCEVDVDADVSFSGLLSGSYGDTNITDYKFSYGDGSDGYDGSSSGPHVHTYDKDGVYVVKMTVTDSEGLKGSEELTMVVGEPFSLAMTPDSDEWVVGDTIKFNLTQTPGSAAPDKITWASSIEHCTTDVCTGETGCHLHSLSQVDTAADGMSGSVVPIAHPLPSQVIITVQMTLDRTVLDYQWPTSAKSHRVETTSSPPGLAVYYGDEMCKFTPCTATFMSNSPASFGVDSIQSTNMKIYQFRRWKVTNPDKSTNVSQGVALNNVLIDDDGFTASAEYTTLAPKFSSNISAPIITAVGAFYTNVQVEWESITDDSVEAVIAYAVTQDHASDSYQSSRALPARISTSAQLLVPAGESNYTVYLRAYDSMNNTLSAKSTEYVVTSPSTFDPSDLCSDDIPRVGGPESSGPDDSRQSEGGSEVVFDADASLIPGIIQAEDFDAGGEGVAYHDNTANDEGQTNYREENEGVDLERKGNTVNVAWTTPGEWLTYTVQYNGTATIVQDVTVTYAVVGGSNGITLALDLDDPSECPDLKQGDDQVIMTNGNLPGTGGYAIWKRTDPASVSLENGPHVITLCFIGNGIVNVDLFEFTDSLCGDSVCNGPGDDEETCTACPQDCGECSTPFTSLTIPGEIEAENFDEGGEGVGFHEDVCVSSRTKNCTARVALMSDYREESEDGEVGLREVDGTISWGWTTRDEWLLYTIMVTVSADYNITLRYASSSTGRANVFLDSNSCDADANWESLLGSSVMPDSGGKVGPFSRTDPFTARIAAGEHTIRVCVAAGGFTLDKLRFDDGVTDAVCDDDGMCDVTGGEGCSSCEDCLCSEGEPFGGEVATIPGFIEAYRFDEGANGVAYWDDSVENLAGGGSRNASVDVEAGADGTFHVGFGVPGEWLKYTVYVPEGGVFNITARYATLADSTALAITVDDGTNLACDRDSDGLVLYDPLLPSTDAWDVWADTEKVEVPLPAGTHVLKLCIINTIGAADTNLKGMDITATAASTSNNKSGRK